VKRAKNSPAVPDRKGLLTGISTKTHKTKLRSASAPQIQASGSHWTFLTNHTHVLLLLSRNPSVVLREVALQVKITERAVQRIIANLESAGVVEREKVGRQNHYRIRKQQPLRHSVTSNCTVGRLLAALNGE